MNLRPKLIQIVVIEFSKITVIILEVENKYIEKTRRSKMSDEGTPLFTFKNPTCSARISSRCTVIKGNFVIALCLLKESQTSYVGH